METTPLQEEEDLEQLRILENGHKIKVRGGAHCDIATVPHWGRYVHTVDTYSYVDAFMAIIRYVSCTPTGCVCGS